MSFKRLLCVLCVAACCGLEVTAQAKPTAKRRLQPSAFVTLNGTFTGIGGSPYNMTTQNPGLGGRNLTLSAGGDFGFLSYGRFDLAVEGRGAYPLLKGAVDGQKSLLGGVRVSREPVGSGLNSILRPYADVLIGGGQIEYVNGGYVTPGLLYLNSTSTVYDIGGGFEIDVTQHLSLKADAQVQRWRTPIAAVGVAIPVTAGLGATYRFGAGDGPR